MSVRKEQRRDPKTKTVREFWFVDFVYRFPDGSTKRVREVSPVNNKRGAEEYERQLRAALQNNTYKQEQKPSTPTLSEFLPQYFAYAELHLKPSSIHDKKKRLNLYILPTLGSKRLDEIGVAEKDNLAGQLKKLGLAPNSINNYLGAVGGVLRYAQELELIDKAPPARFVKVTETKFDFLDFEEYSRLLVVAKESPWYTAILLAGDAGLRLGEVRALGWSDIDFVAGQTTVRRALWKNELGTTKGGRERKVPLTERLKKALKAARHLKGDLIVCRDDGEPFSAEVLDKWLGKLSKKAGLRPIGWHALRHTFCSHLAMRGATATAIQELAGHQSLTTTQRYVHLAPSHLREAIQLLDGVLVKGSNTTTGE